MKSAIKRLLILTCFFEIIFLFFAIPRAHAAGNFITDYDITYTVANNGQTHANMKVTLTNGASDYYYATSYKVELGFDHLSNISAADQGGVITPQINKSDNGYTITLDFNKKVVGIGNKQTFNLAFDTPDIAQKEGKIWEINVPGIADQKSFNSFNVDIHMPEGFGKPAYIKPCPAKPDTATPQKNLQTVGNCSYDTLHFTKDQLTKSGISLAYGTEQQYSYTLLYHLQNRNLFSIRTEIALPPNTNYQSILLDSLDPEPTQMTQDEDGNWLAEYILSPAQEIDVKAKGRVNITLTPKKESLSEDNRKEYLQEKPYWQVSNNRIQSVGKALKTPEAIYDYVINTLHYDFSRITNNNNRLGAVNVLEHPSSAVCLEFTDLFITLARAAGIPAREVDGYAYSENPRQRPLSLVQDVLHAWPEYYDTDKQTWIMVDPTWGNTTGGVDYFHTLDFDHFTFVKKGMSSTYPVPAGGYKVSGEENRKDVFVWSSQDDTIQPNQLVIKPIVSSTYLAGLPIDGEVTIMNKGPQVSSGDKLQISSDNLNPLNQTIKIDDLLPYENKKIPFHFDKQPFLTNKTYTITMNVAKKEYKETIKVVPFVFENLKLIGGLIIAILAIIILIFTLKTRRIRIS